MMADPKKTEKNPMGWRWRVRDTSRRIVEYCFDERDADELAYGLARRATRGGWARVDYWLDGRWHGGNAYSRQCLIDCGIITADGWWA